MAGWSTTAKNTALDALTLDLMSLHNGDPGAAGTANELSGGGYARVACTFDAANAGARALGGNVTFAATANTSVTYFGVWKNAGTVFEGSSALTGDQSANAAGQYVVTAAGTSMSLT